MNPQLRRNPILSNVLFNDSTNHQSTSNISSTYSSLNSHCSLADIPTMSIRRLIHLNFTELKKSLGLAHFKRKTQIDSLLKKCKSKAFKSIHEAIKQCFKAKIPRLPQSFITNIKIDFNKNFLNKTIMEIYQQNHILGSLQEMKSKGMINENKEWALEEFLQLTLVNVFEYYINSKQFIIDYMHIIQREGEKFGTLFYFISKVFITYYTQTKGNRPKNNKKKEINNSSHSSHVQGIFESKDIFTVKKREREILVEKEHFNMNYEYDYQGSSCEQFIPIKIIANEELA